MYLVYAILYPMETPKYELELDDLELVNKKTGEVYDLKLELEKIKDANSSDH